MPNESIADELCNALPPLILVHSRPRSSVQRAFMETPGGGHVTDLRTTRCGVVSRPEGFQ